MFAWHTASCNDYSPAQLDTDFPSQNKDHVLVGQPTLRATRDHYRAGVQIIDVSNLDLTCGVLLALSCLISWLQLEY